MWRYHERIGPSVKPEGVREKNGRHNFSCVLFSNKSFLGKDARVRLVGGLPPIG